MADQTDAETGILKGRGGAIDESIAAGTGTTLPMVNAVRQFIRTGVRPMSAPVGPPTEDGTEATAFPVVDDKTQSAIAKALQRSLVLRTNLKDTKPDDLAKATGEYRDQDLSDAVIAGQVPRNTVAGAQAAAGGKSLYHFGENGTVGDLFGGGLDESGGLARGNIKLKTEQAGAERAQAAERYAAAGQHAASTQKTRQEIEQGVKTGNLKLEHDAEGNIVVVDLANRTVQPALDDSGQAVKGGGKGGGKDIPPTVNAKIIEGKQGLRNIDEAIAALEKNPGAVGITNAIPGAQTLRGQIDSAENIATRAKIANIGSLKLHDRSGAAVSASEFPRLAPFIPSASDSPRAAATKLREMKKIAEQELGLFADTYSPANGYRASTATAPAAAPVTGFTYLGKE
jgi:hypothetical protein